VSSTYRYNNNNKISTTVLHVILYIIRLNFVWFSLIAFLYYNHQNNHIGAARHCTLISCFFYISFYTLVCLCLSVKTHLSILYYYILYVCLVITTYNIIYISRGSAWVLIGTRPKIELARLRDDGESFLLIYTGNICCFSTLLKL